MHLKTYNIALKPIKSIQNTYLLKQISPTFEGFFCAILLAIPKTMFLIKKGLDGQLGGQLGGQNNVFK
jgi:hypothetical protein